MFLGIFSPNGTNEAGSYCIFICNRKELDETGFWFTHAIYITVVFSSDCMSLKAPLSVSHISLRIKGNRFITFYYKCESKCFDNSRAQSSVENGTIGNRSKKRHFIWERASGESTFMFVIECVLAFRWENLSVHHTIHSSVLPNFLLIHALDRLPELGSSIKKIILGAPLEKKTKLRIFDIILHSKLIG